MTPQKDFGTRLDSAFAQFGHLCVGIDPHPYLFDRWGYDDNPRSLSEFSKRVLDACVDYVGIIKPQVAFYERWGSAGYRALEELISHARQAGIVVIADAKRGDIGSTMQAYAQTWLSPGTPLEADALTVSPYLGLGALDETMTLARAHAKGIFVLAATSNPEAIGIQTSVATHGEDAGLTVAQTVVSRVHTSNMLAQQVSGGVVLGATVDLREFGIEPEQFPGLPVLAPGFGFQGAHPRDARRLFGALSERLILTETRSILEAGPDEIRETVAKRAAIVAESLA